MTQETGQIKSQIWIMWMIAAAAALGVAGFLGVQTYTQTKPTPFQIAFKADDFEAMAEILERDRGEAGQMWSGRSYVMIAVEEDNLEKVRFLFENASVPTLEKNIVLAHAVEEENAKLFDLALEHGANPSSAIPLAAGLERVEYLGTLLDKGGDPDVLDGQALIDAVRLGKFASVEMLLERGANPERGKRRAVNLAQRIGGRMDKIFTDWTAKQVEIDNARKAELEAKVAAEMKRTGANRVVIDE